MRERWCRGKKGSGVLIEGPGYRIMTEVYSDENTSPLLATQFEGVRLTRNTSTDLSFMLSDGKEIHILKRCRHTTGNSHQKIIIQYPRNNNISMRPIEGIGHYLSKEVSTASRYTLQDRIHTTSLNSKYFVQDSS